MGMLWFGHAAKQILKFNFHLCHRERILRLQHENKMLKLHKSSSEDENSQLLQTMLDDRNARNNELETEVR